MTSDLHHLAAAYTLDALDDDERRAFEAHYPSCDVCTEEVTDFRAVATALAETAATAPPADLKARVMAEIAETRQLSPLTDKLPPKPRSFGLMALAAAAALVLVGGLFAVALVLQDRNGDDTDEVVSSPDAIVTTLDPTSDTQKGMLQVVWSNERDQLVVVGSNLADPGANLAYALWFLLDDGVAPAGLFRPRDGSVSAVLNVDDIDATGWGITIEPATGSAQPTTEVIFAGAI